MKMSQSVTAAPDRATRTNDDGQTRIWQGGWYIAFHGYQSFVPGEVTPEQAKLLMKYRIDTWDQLDMFTEAVQGEIDALCNQRKDLYRQKRSNPQNENSLSKFNPSINPSKRTGGS